MKRVDVLEGDMFQGTDSGNKKLHVNLRDLYQRDTFVYKRGHEEKDH